MNTQSVSKHTAGKGRPSSRRRNRRHPPFRVGAAVVEFAIVAPLLLLLTMGMMEVGRMVMVKQLLVNASREGARLAVLPGSTSAEVTAQVRQQLEESSVSGATIVINPVTQTSVEGTPMGQPITVQVSISAATISWVPKPMFSFSNILEAATTMRKESM
ncbi:MAG: pilus assembly protein [Planctomycetales bacterium]|nr:pilus assembly protein [Planctomycetales bacterium]